MIEARQGGDEHEQKFKITALIVASSQRLFG
jgi:hypothetical protein